MLGGKIIGEGVDGCVSKTPMWPCVAGTEGIPSPDDTHYVSKIVSNKDTEPELLKMAAELLGPDLSSKYLAKLQGECKPANPLNPPSQKNAASMAQTKANIQAWQRKGQACGDIKKKLELGINISKDSKILILSKYPNTMSGWAVELQTSPKPYLTVLQGVEKAIPKFILILQKLYQGSSQLIHLDLHTGNIFVKFRPLEFGIADFGRCVFRRSNLDAAETFYGAFLIDNVSNMIPFYSGYSQVPFESRLLSFCYKKNMDAVNPVVLVKAWENDPDVINDSNGSCDVVVFNRATLINNLLKRILFIAMVETIQSICRKLRLYKGSSGSLFQSMKPVEKKAVEFILTRYSIISPINTITEELMHVYPVESFRSNSLVTFLMKAIQAPYDQDGSSLIGAIESVQAADLGILWSDTV